MSKLKMRFIMRIRLMEEKEKRREAKFLFDVLTSRPWLSGYQISMDHSNIFTFYFLKQKTIIDKKMNINREVTIQLFENNRL